MGQGLGLGLLSRLGRRLQESLSFGLYLLEGSHPRMGQGLDLLPGLGLRLRLGLCLLLGKLLCGGMGLSTRLGL